MIELEKTLLEAIQADPSDEATRLAYADWLEERGDSRAEFVRTEQSLSRSELTSRKRKSLLKLRNRLRVSLNADWVAVIAQGRIEACHFDRQDECPKNWAKIQATNNNSVRRCDICQRNVYYCDNIDQTILPVGNGEPVFIDPIVNRKKGDLDVVVEDIGSWLEAIEETESPDLKKPGIWQRLLNSIQHLRIR